MFTAVYTSDIRPKQSFIPSIKSVLNDMANILRDIEEVCPVKTHPSFRTVSTRSSHLYLKYHQVMLQTASTRELKY